MALSSATSVAAESQRRIAVLKPDSELLRAISLSLSVWDVETIPSDAPPPQSSQPEAVEGASSIARQLRVEAVVWMSSTDGGSLVWVFDARAGDVTTRMLADKPPFDSAAAAAVALSVKTVLRASVVAPPAERFGARAAAAPKAARANVSSHSSSGGRRAGLRSEQTALRATLAAVAWIAAAKRLGIGLSFRPDPG